MLVQLFDPGSHYYDVTGNRVLFSEFSTHISGDSLSEMKSYPDPGIGQNAMPAFQIQLLNHIHGRINSILTIFASGYGRTEGGHETVAQDLIDNTMVMIDGIDHE